MKLRSARSTASFGAVFFALAAQAALAANPVPAPLQGAWVPASATCDSTLRIQVAANQLTLVNAADKQTLGGNEMAGPGYFAPGYRGIEAVLITEFDGHQPATMTFNAGEKRGVARIEFSPVTPGPGPALKAINAHLTKLALAKRFPLDKAALKKCG